MIKEFKEDHSTYYLLFVMITHCQQNQNNAGICTFIHTDIKKAFDPTEHEF